MKQPRILIIAGSDSSGGAGIQADVKTITSLGGYAATAITAITSQNTTAVSSIHQVPSSIIREQIEMTLDDIGADVIKIGMLLNEDVINTVADTLDKYPDIPIVLDPVMVATSGGKLFEDKALDILLNRLIKKSFLLTPNTEEAEILSKIKISSEEDMIEAGKNINAPSVLIKGGHLDGDEITDILVSKDNIKIWKSKRIKSKNTHGTGCSLASAIATFLGQGISLEDSISKARDYIAKAIENAPGFGQGNGPLNHTING